MTIAISLKVHDGVVLAADSASTLVAQGEGGVGTVVNIYNHANKVFNLRKGLPVGAITWGSGAMGAASTETLMKDLRRELTTGDDPIDGDSYTIGGVAERVREFIFERHYKPAYGDWPPEDQPALGFIVAGYSATDRLATEYQIDVVGGECGSPRQLREPNETGLTWGGQTEAISRLMMGFGTALPEILRQNLGVEEDQVPQLMGVLQSSLTAPLVQPAMPIQDAIHLAQFLVDMTIRFQQYMPGAPTVGGAVEVAAITKHEGFTWVSRKHYFDQSLNPGRQES